VEDGADLLECDLLEQEETMVETPAVEPPTIGGATKRLNYFKKICPILLQINSEILGLIGLVASVAVHPSRSCRVPC